MLKCIKHSCPVLLVLLLLSVVSIRDLFAQGASATEPVRVAVVDMKIILEKYQRVQDSADKLKELGQTGRTELIEMEKKLKTLEKILRLPTADEQKKLPELQKQFLQLQIEIGSKNAELRYEYRQAYIEHMKKIHDDIRKACATIAKKKNFNLVIPFSSDLSNVNDPGNFNFTFTDKLLYYSDSIDITEEVKNLLNKNYRTVNP